MAEKDIREHTLLDYKDIFADVVNVLLFQGKRLIQPNDLIDEEGRSQYKFYGSARQQERDIIKRWQDGGIRIALIGLENQTQPDKLMPVRIISYDGASYRRQLSAKKKKEITPVVTMVLYYGFEKRWNTSKQLTDMMQIPPDLGPYFQNYSINVFEIAWLDDVIIDMFQSDFWILADFLRQMRKTGDYHPKRSNAAFTRVVEVLQLMAAIRNDDRYLEPEIIEYFQEQKGEGNMDYLIDRWIEKGVVQGREQGLEQGLEQGRTEADKNAILSIMRKLHLTMDEAMEAMSIEEKERPKYRKMVEEELKAHV